MNPARPTFRKFEKRSYDDQAGKNRGYIIASIQFAAMQLFSIIVHKSKNKNGNRQKIEFRVFPYGYE